MSDNCVMASHERYLDKLNTVALFLAGAPLLERVNVCEYEGVTVVRVAGTIWLLGGGDCGGSGNWWGMNMRGRGGGKGAYSECGEWAGGARADAK